MKKSWLTFVPFLLAVMCLRLIPACDPPTTDDQQSAQQAQALEQAHAQIGMPAVTSFAERKMVKDLYELRDKSMPTHTYVMDEPRGCLVHLGASVGYGLPYATQFTSPTRIIHQNGNREQVPQAEPNGLFMPTSAEGTWVMLKEPGEEKVQPVYVEPRVIVSPFRLREQECPPPSPTPPTPAAPSAAPAPPKTK